SSLALLFALAAPFAACGGGDDPQTGDEDDLTSLTARERNLAFDGYVYVSAGASDYDITAAINRETKSAMGALRNALIGVNDRELKDVDPATWVREPVTIADPNSPDAAGTPALRVR